MKIFTSLYLCLLENKLEVKLPLPWEGTEDLVVAVKATRFPLLGKGPGLLRSLVVAHPL